MFHLRERLTDLVADGVMRGQGLVWCAWLGVVGAALPAQQPIPVRELGPVIWKATEPTAHIDALWVLQDGRVFVSDSLAYRRLLLFEPTLSRARVVADSSIEAPDRFWPNRPGFLPASADSEMIVGGNARTFLVLEASGKPERVMAAPRAQDVFYLASSWAGRPGLHAKARLIYRGVFPPIVIEPIRGEPLTQVVTLDSFPIVRADIETQVVDTLAIVRMPPPTRTIATRNDSGEITRRSIHRPVTTVDDWTITSDGTVAIVRGHDYHIDWINADGTRTSTAPMPFSWRTLTGKDRRLIMDSMRVDLGRRTTDPQATADFVESSEVPDVFPPFRRGAVQADRDGNVWILPSATRAGNVGQRYDVVNRRGEVAERVDLPTGCSLAGFAPGSVVFVSCGRELQRRRVLR